MRFFSCKQLCKILPFYFALKINILKSFHPTDLNRIPEENPLIFNVVSILWLTLNKGGWFFSCTYKPLAHDLHQVTSGQAAKSPPWAHRLRAVRECLYIPRDVSSLFIFLPEEKVKLYCCWGKGLFLQAD